MNIDSMIAVLTAKKNGEEIECKPMGSTRWLSCHEKCWNFTSMDYRIAPKKMTLVDELREVAKEAGTLNLPVEQVVLRAADRITELESCEPAVWLKDTTTDELLAEIKRRTL